MRAMDEYSISKTGEHLNLLAIFHYVVAGMMCLMSLIPIIHLTVGIVFLLAPPPSKPGEPPPALFGAIFVVIGALAILIGMAISALVLYSGISLSRRRRYMFCLVVSCLMCLWMPFGTILGVLTLVVLLKDEAKYLFGTGEFSGEDVEAA